MPNDPMVIAFRVAFVVFAVFAVVALVTLPRGRYVGFHALRPRPPVARPVRRLPLPDALWLPEYATTLTADGGDRCHRCGLGAEPATWYCGACWPRVVQLRAVTGGMFDAFPTSTTEATDADL